MGQRHATSNNYAYKLASSAAYAIYISEVAEAKNQIPDVPAIISETQAAQTKADRKIAALERELTKTKERQRQARADLSITNHKLTKLADGKPHTEETWEVCLFALALAEAREQVVASFYHNMDLLQSRIAAFSKGI